MLNTMLDTENLVVSEQYDSKKMTTKKTTKKTTKTKPRSFQVSMPEHYHTYLKILSLVGGTNVSELLRSLAEPYLGFAKNVLIERNYTNQWGQVVTDTEEMLNELEKEIKNNPEKFLHEMVDYGKKHNVEFKFVNVDKMFV